MPLRLEEIVANIRRKIAEQEEEYVRCKTKGGDPEMSVVLLTDYHDTLGERWDATGIYDRVLGKGYFPCPTCNGSGEIRVINLGTDCGTQICGVCGGEGKIKETS